LLGLGEDLIRSWTAAKLARDFREWHAPARAYGPTLGEDDLYETYVALRHGFEMAADSGAVEFC
jgi:hypothetical protein